ncbi:MAG: tRNA (adenosine(37)-N6)-threonylcarbamoyltransferase complex transferase subunit TsaD, partial [Candidatus Binatia bacterium]
AGGVSANRRLRTKLDRAVGKTGGRLVFPSMGLCTDNAAMIAFAASKRLDGDLPEEELTAVSRLPLGPRRGPRN